MSDLGPEAVGRQLGIASGKLGQRAEIAILMYVDCATAVMLMSEDRWQPHNLLSSALFPTVYAALKSVLNA